MAGRASLIPTVTLHTTLPADLYARVQQDLFSPSEGRVPKGAWKEFLTALISNHYAKVNPPAETPDVDVQQ